MPFAANGDVQLHYEEHGSGPECIVLIPGLGLPGTAWAPVVEQLAPHLRVLVHEPRGSGDSDAPSSDRYTAETVADDLFAVLDAAGVRQAHLVGFSMGGLISQDFALRYPDRVRSMVLLATYAAPDEWLRRVLSLRAEMIQKLGMIDHFRVFLPFVFSPLAFRTIPERVHAVETRMQTNPPAQDAYLRQIEYCLAHSVTAELRDVSAPTTVVCGSHDLLTSFPLCQELATAIPGATYTKFDGASHALWLERTAEFSRLCLDFVEDSRLLPTT